MPGGGFAWRFGFEAGFLVLLGAGAGYANLRPVVIVGLLAGGWVLVSLIELTVWLTRGPRTVQYVPPPPAPAQADAEPVHEPVGWPVDDRDGDEVAYPLRADAGREPSEELEAYTRILEPEAQAAGEQPPE